MSHRDRIFIFATGVVLAGAIWHAGISAAVAQDVNPDYASFEKAGAGRARCPSDT
jgi:hypothetical protein